MIAVSGGVLSTVNFLKNLLVRTIRMPKHQLSHQTLHAAYHRLALDAWPSAAEGWTLVPYEQLEDYAIPRLLDRYFERIGNSDT